MPFPATAVAADLALVIAHRGASALAPENTLAAADAAREAGALWVETDVRRTADGELILMHDDTLERTTDASRVFPGRAPWHVSQFTAAEIARLDAGSWFGDRFAGEPVPTLAEFLDQLAVGGQRLLLELKSPGRHPGIEAEVLRELKAAGWLDEPAPGARLVVQSFDAQAVRTVHELAPEVVTGFLGRPPAADLPRYAAFADQINPEHTTVTAGWLRRLRSLTGPHGRPLAAHAWTVDDGPAAVRLAALGVDGLITNVPQVIRAALGR